MGYHKPETATRCNAHLPVALLCGFAGVRLLVVTGGVMLLPELHGGVPVGWPDTVGKECEQELERQNDTVPAKTLYLQKHSSAATNPLLHPLFSCIKHPVLPVQALVA